MPVTPNRMALRFAVSGGFAAFVLGALLAFTPDAALAQGSLHGHGRTERIKGDPTKGYLEHYEYKAFLSPTGTGTGFSYHMGDPGTAQHGGQGCITLTGIPAGNYTLLTSWGEFFPRGKVAPGAVINNGQQTTHNADQPIDYSGYYTQLDWDPSGANPIFQTFVATGTSITRASFAKADNTSGGSINFSIHQSNGGNVETWPQVGPARSRSRGGYGGDHWVSWDAGEVATTPGQTYAIRLFASNGVNIQPYWSDDSFYTGGRGYRGNQASPANHDYYIIVYSDNDGTIHTMTNRSHGYNNLFAEYHQKFAQSYTARGTSFAGSTLMATLGGASGWNFTVQVSLHSGTPGGPQVGPTKTMPCAFAPFAGVAGAAFALGEAPTTIGQTYWIVYERPGGLGFNAYTMNEGDTYSGGTGAYYDNPTWTTLGQDMLINIFEYASTGAPTSTPTITPTPAPGANILQNFGFEQSIGQNHTAFWINPGAYGTNGAFPSPGGAQEGSQWADKSYGGGAFQQFELYQTVTVTPGSLYRLATYCNLGGTNGTAVGKLMWKNGSYTGDLSGTLLDSETWTSPAGFIPWTEMSGLVTPTGTQLTIILRTEITGFGGGANWDNCSVVLQSAAATATPTRTPTPTTPAVATPTPTRTPTQGPTPTPFPTQSGVNTKQWEGYR